MLQISYNSLSLRLCKQFLTFFYSLLYGTHVKESLLWQVIQLTIENHIEALDGIFY